MPDGQTAAVAVTDGYATIDLADPTNPTVLAERRGLAADREDGPMQGVFDAAVDGETLAVVGPANPTREAVPEGVVFVDASDPSDPTQLAFYEAGFPIHNCAFEDGFLYLTGNGASGSRAPMVVIDATDPAAPEAVGQWRLTEYDERWEEVAFGLRPIHDVWVQDGLAAAAYWDAGTYLLDVSDPTSPTHLGTVPAVDVTEATTASGQQATVPPGNHHYTATDEANELLAVGKESWGLASGDDYVGGPSGIELYDIGDPTEPTKLADIEPPASSDPTFQGVWTTAHNFEIRDETLYSAWYHGGVKRHDISDPANPRELSWWADPETARFWTAQAITPGETLLASTMGTDRSEAGLRVFPEADGTAGNPEALTDTPTPTETPTATEFPGTPTPTETPPPTSEQQTTQPTTDDRTTAVGPGLGVTAGLTALGAYAWRRREE